MKFITVFATLLTSNLVLSLDLDSCGVPNDDQINLDGCQEATPHQFPWHVQIFVCGFYCGGSIITDRHILTSGHCIDGCGEFDVVIGAPDSQYTVSSHKGFLHPEYDFILLANDIGILELDEPIEFGSVAQPICLATSNDYEDQITISSDYVKYSRVQIMNQNECEEYWGQLNENVICSDVNCDCDVITSGGTLALAGPTYQQIGITSFGSSFGCDENIPKVHTEVYPYLNWISSVTGLELK